MGINNEVSCTYINSIIYFIPFYDFLSECKTSLYLLQLKYFEPFHCLVGYILLAAANPSCFLMKSSLMVTGWAQSLEVVVILTRVKQTEAW